MARERWWRQMHNYRDYIHLLLGSMRREVEYAKSKDVDAQSCYNINSEAIDMHAETAYDTATKCIESAEKSIQKSLSFIDSLISLGEQLIKELKDLTMNCYDENSIAMQSCLLLEFGKVNTAVENFNDDAKNIQYSVISASNYVVLQATQCVTNTYDSAYFESYSQMISNADCVRIALDKKKKN
ncbi:uncharacterized protein LOC105433283 [Pogonomyrmex barbatus]|uniref:Uncharacterized protein LOC105433283 n=1 Tax=Pogonomyrmex barbatus TaxID=144034 RepID=A0A6I9WS91_9HYME|nr:uncharacterized protein LOC105433283 [Pogonomyrmex barbatus]